MSVDKAARSLEWQQADCWQYGGHKRSYVIRLFAADLKDPSQGRVPILAGLKLGEKSLAGAERGATVEMSEKG